MEEPDCVEERDATPTHYFLVEIWVERSNIEGAAPIARAKLRDLATQRVEYVKSPTELVEFLETSLEQAGAGDARWQEGSV